MGQLGGGQLPQNVPGPNLTLGDPFSWLDQTSPRLRGLWTLTFSTASGLGPRLAWPRPSHPTLPSLVAQSRARGGAQSAGGERVPAMCPASLQVLGTRQRRKVSACFSAPPPPKPCLPPPSRAPSVEARTQRSQHRLEKKREGPGVSTRCRECVRLIEGSHQVLLPVRPTAQEAHLPERHTEAQRSQAVPRVTWEWTWSLPSQGQPANTFQSLGQQ